jgi:hypothetical protein
MSRNHAATIELEQSLAAIATIRALPLEVVLLLVEDRRHAAEVFEAYDSNPCVRRTVKRALNARIQASAEGVQ